MAKNKVAPIPAKDRLMKKVMKHAVTGCWEWTGSRNRLGYGRITVNGRVELAHRVSMQEFRGVDPAGLSVCHKCDNPCCINPEHLFVGTQLDNMRDCAAKGRRVFVRGELQKAAKLNPDLVRMIRRSKKSNCQLSRELGISDVAISSARLRKTWAWVETEADAMAAADAMGTFA